jgi:hypothetical protein
MVGEDTQGTWRAREHVVDDDDVVDGKRRGSVRVSSVPFFRDVRTFVIS